MHFEIPLAVFIYCTYLLFVMSFLDIEKYYRLIFQASRFFIYFFLGYIIIDKIIWYRIGSYASVQLYYAIRALFFVLGIFYGYLILRIRTKLSAYIISGTFFLFIGIGLNLYFSYELMKGRHSILSFWDYPQTYTQIGILFEIVFFSVGLGYKNRIQIYEKNQALMKNMQTQMKPHFIYNCLNSLKALIYERDTRKAVRYLTKFGKLMRMVLEKSEKSLVTLEDELEMCRLYLNMEKTRFIEDFDSSILVDSSVNLDQIFIPPLALQPYIENALWHGLLNKLGHRILKVQIKEDNGKVKCIVDDNGIGRAKAKALQEKSLSKKKDFGLELSAKRLNHYGITINIIDKVDFENSPTGTKVEIFINP